MEATANPSKPSPSPAPHATKASSTPAGTQRPVDVGTPTARAGEKALAGASPGEPKIAFDGITFDDVLLIPSRSAVMPAEANTATRLTARIALNIPLIS